MPKAYKQKGVKRASKRLLISKHQHIHLCHNSLKTNSGYVHKVKLRNIDAMPKP
jgi:hypothetical protein